MIVDHVGDEHMGFPTTGGSYFKPTKLNSNYMNHLL
jgi:hypothetical protein